MLSLRGNISIFSPNKLNLPISQIGCSLHTSPVLKRRGAKKVRKISEEMRESMAKGPWYKKPTLVMTSPLGTTVHPVNKFESKEEDFLKEVDAKSCEDFPVDIEDPYSKVPKMCVLCPRKFKENIMPSYKNPKLLSQFVSPHTGHVYQAHITGLCSYMQEIVEREVDRSRVAGFMSTKVINPQYSQDPPLFNPNKPMKPNSL